MADYTPEEQEEISNRYYDELRRLGQATPETTKAFVDAKVGVRDFTATLTKDFKGLGNAAINLGKQLNQGVVGSSVFNESLDALADTVSTVSSTLGPLGKAFGLAGQAVVGYVKAVNQQADALYDAYEQMSRAGATGAEGLQGVYANLKNLNLAATAEGLAKFNTIVNENAKTFALFGKTVNSGVTEFANVANQIQRSDIGRQFREMGIGVDGINEGIASFIKMQQLTGGRQRMTTEELTKSTAAYIREVDLITKLTGQTRREQEAARESAMEEERFAALQTELQQRAAMGDKAAEAQLKTLNNVQQMLDKQAPEVRKGFLNILSGTLDTPEASKLLLTLPNAAAVAGKQFFTETEFFAALFKDSNAALNGFSKDLGKIGANNQSFIRIQDLIKLKSMSELGSYDEREKAAERNQDITDESTKSQTDLRDAQRRSRDTLNDLLNAGIVPVTNAMKALASGTDTVIEGFKKAAQAMGVTVQERGAAALSGGTGAYTAPSEFVGAAPRAVGTAAPKAAAPRAVGTAVPRAPTSLQDQITLAQDDIAGLTRELSRIPRDEKSDRRLYISTELQSAQKRLDKLLNSSPTSAGRPSEGYKFGGIASGPEEGYETTLHGTEAVVPLPDGRTIPVEFVGAEQQMGLMSAQLSRLDDIVRVMQNQLNVSQKILQYAQ